MHWGQIGRVSFLLRIGVFRAKLDGRKKIISFRWRGNFSLLPWRLSISTRWDRPESIYTFTDENGALTGRTGNWSKFFSSLMLTRSFRAPYSRLDCDRASRLFPAVECFTRIVFTETIAHMRASTNGVALSLGEPFAFSLSLSFHLPNRPPSRRWSQALFAFPAAGSNFLHSIISVCFLLVRS